MRKNFYMVPELNNMSMEEIRGYQEKKLTKQLKYGYEKSEFYRKKFDEIGIKPEEVKTIKDLRYCQNCLRSWTRLVSG